MRRRYIVRHGSVRPWLVMALWAAMLLFVFCSISYGIGPTVAAARTVIGILGRSLLVLAGSVGAAALVVGLVLAVGGLGRAVRTRRTAGRQARVDDAERWRDWSVEHDLLSSAALWTTIAAHRREELDNRRIID